jgi:hypothetical protein
MKTALRFGLGKYVLPDESTATPYDVGIETDVPGAGVGGMVPPASVEISG